MGWTRLDFDLAEVLGGLAITLILTGLLIRNVISATTSVEMAQAFGATIILALGLGYKFASWRLGDQASGVLLLLVGGLIGGLMALLAPTAFSERDTIAAFAVLILLATIFIVSPWISISTRSFGVLVLFTALSMGSLEFTVFDGEDISKAIVVAVLGIVMIVWPTVLEEVDKK